MIVANFGNRSYDSYASGFPRAATGECISIVIGKGTARILEISWAMAPRHARDHLISVVDVMDVDLLTAKTARLIQPVASRPNQVPDREH